MVRPPIHRNATLVMSLPAVTENQNMDNPRDATSSGSFLTSDKKIFAQLPKIPSLSAYASTAIAHTASRQDGAREDPRWLDDVAASSNGTARIPASNTA